MKKLIALTTVITSLFLISCNSNPSQPDYSSSTIPSLARGGDDKAQIESNPPYGTLYGSGNRSITSQGDEYLKDEYWVKNDASNDYEIEVFESTGITLSVTTIYVDSPSGVTYKHQTLGWQSLSSSGYITTDSLKVNSTGGCYISTEAEIDISDLGGNIG
ncbi:MAG: hypothetical protein HQ510_06330 [Candidatus Marinimicrobia bacterium]|nr:hypothetical protein [Candidatus Neomarinimicrobiota bacterium]